MASLQASLRGQSVGANLPVAQIVTNVNRMVWATSPENRYATFFYAQYDLGRRRMEYVNGGHNAPFLFRGGKDLLRLEACGPPVGLFEKAEYECGAVDVEPGDLLVLYTDGMTEAMNDADEEWGEDQMIELLRGGKGTAEEIMEAVFVGADAFAAGAAQHDDMTVMVFRFEGPW